MATPTLCPTSASNETFGGVTYHLEGELVPVLHIELDRVPVYFEHHVLLWKHPAVAIGIKSLAGAFKRILSGMPVFMTEASGKGHIAFSRDGAGHIVPMHLKPGQTIEVREHQFLAATGGVDYTFQRVKGIANLLMGGTGFFIDTFHAARGEGIVWLHGYGNVFEVTLSAGESIDIEPGAWVYKDPGVQMETQFQKLTTGLFASAGQMAWNRFTGPGRVGIQSMSLHLPAAE
ncbi:MAG: AIM24 family protein [Gemmatimonadales bacterium]